MVSVLLACVELLSMEQGKKIVKLVKVRSEFWFSCTMSIDNKQEETFMFNIKGPRNLEHQKSLEIWIGPLTKRHAYTLVEFILSVISSMGNNKYKLQVQMHWDCFDVSIWKQKKWAAYIKFRLNGSNNCSFSLQQHGQSTFPINVGDTSK